MNNGPELESFGLYKIFLQFLQKYFINFYFTGIIDAIVDKQKK